MRHNQQATADNDEDDDSGVSTNVSTNNLPTQPTTDLLTGQQQLHPRSQGMISSFFALFRPRNRTPDNNLPL